jgi:hypothetical protein
MSELQNKLLILLLIMSVGSLNAIKSTVEFKSEKNTSYSTKPLNSRSSQLSPEQITANLSAASKITPEQTHTYASYQTQSHPEYVDLSTLSTMESRVAPEISTNFDTPPLKLEQTLEQIQKTPIQVTNSINLKAITHFDQTAPADYAPSYKNEFMSVPAKFYTKALQKQFPDVSQEDLTTYTNLFLQENSGHYQQKSGLSLFYQNDLTQPIIIKPADIIIDPKQPANSPLQQLYNKISGKPVDNNFDIQINTPILDHIGTGVDYVTSRVTPGVIHNLDQAASNIIEGITTAGDYAHQGITTTGNTIYNIGSNIHEAVSNPQQFVKRTANIAIRQGAAYIKDALTNPLDANAESFIDPETNKAFEDLFHTGAQVGFKAANNYVKDAIAEQGKPKKEGPNPEQDLADAQKIAQQLAEQAMQDGTVVSKLAAEKAAQVVAEKQQSKDTQDAANALLDSALTYGSKAFDEALGLPETVTPETDDITETKNKIIDPNESQAVSFTTKITDDVIKKMGVPEKQVALQRTAGPQASTITNYIIGMFRDSVRAAIKTPEKLKLVIKKIVSTTSYLCGYPPIATVETEMIIDQAFQKAMDKDGMAYAKDNNDFDKKFKSWTGSLITKICDTLGKEAPENIQTVKVIGKKNDSTSPTMTVIYNKNQHTLKSGSITYDGQSYQLDPKNFQFDEATQQASATSPLYSKQSKPTLVSSNIVTPIIRNITDSLRSIDPSTNKFLKSWGDYADEKLTGQVSDGQIKITFDNNDPTKLIQEIRKVAPDLSTMITTTDYTRPNSNEKIKLAGDMSTPIIDIELDSQGQLQSIDVTFDSYLDNKILHANNKTISHNKVTGIYTIRATFDAPAKMEQTGQNAINESIKKLQDRIAPTIINALDSSYGLTSAKTNDLLIKNAIDESVRWLSEPIPTAIQTVIITYDPTSKQFSTLTTKTMSDGKVVKTPLDYPAK